MWCWKRSSWKFGERRVESEKYWEVKSVRVGVREGL